MSWKLYMNLPSTTIMECFGLLYKLHRGEASQKKLEFVVYHFRCSHNSILFFRTEYMELKLSDK